MLQKQQGMQTQRKPLILSCEITKTFSIERSNIRTLYH